MYSYGDSLQFAWLMIIKISFGNFPMVWCWLVLTTRFSFQLDANSKQPRYFYCFCSSNFHVVSSFGFVQCQFGIYKKSWIFGSLMYVLFAFVPTCWIFLKHGATNWTLLSQRLWFTALYFLLASFQFLELKIGFHEPHPLFFVKV